MKNGLGKMATDNLNSGKQGVMFKLEDLENKDQFLSYPIIASFIEYGSGRWTQARSVPWIPGEMVPIFDQSGTHNGKSPQGDGIFHLCPIRGKYPACITPADIVIKHILWSWDNQPHLLK